MKVFFTASQRGKKLYEKYYHVIHEELVSLGYKITADDLFTTQQEQFYQKLEDADHRAYVGFYKKKIESIKEADINIFECSTPSLSIGFVIEKSLEYNKPTVVLYFKENVPFFLAGVEDEKLVVKSYKEDNLTKVLKDSLELARERRDKRFNFFISPKLLEYLEQTSEDQGITKSTFIRNLIIDHMHRTH